MSSITSLNTRCLDNEIIFYIIHHNNVFDDNKNVFLPKLDSKNQFEHLPFAKNFSIHDSIILDLSISKEKLWENLSYDRKKILQNVVKKI